jgi:TonB family protein
MKKSGTPGNRASGAVRLLLPLLLALPGTAHAADTWAPAGKWNLDFGNSSCTLGRVFTAGAQEASLGFRSAPPSRTFSLLLAVPETMFAGRAKAISVSAPGLAAPVKLPFFGDVVLKPGMRQLSLTISRASFAPLLSAKELTIEGAGSTVTVPTGGSAGVATAMTKCEEDLVKEWKIDPAELANGFAAPAGDPRTWIKAADYPAEARAARKEGEGALLLRIEADGKVEQCRVIESTGTPQLDEAACALVKKRASYTAAKNGNGETAASWQRFPFQWKLPYLVCSGKNQKADDVCTLQEERRLGALGGTR